MPGILTPRSPGEILSRSARAGFSLFLAFGVTITLFYGMERLICLDGQPSLPGTAVWPLKKQEAKPFHVNLVQTITCWCCWDPVSVPRPEQVPFDPRTRAEKPPALLPVTGFAQPAAYTPDPAESGFAVESAVLLARATPQYPRKALWKGLSGYVMVGYDVDAFGQVITPYVIDSSNEIFERNALRTVRKFKYKAKTLNGVPVVQKGLRLKFTFGLENEK